MKRPHLLILIQKISSKGLDELIEGRTSFIIAHRLSTIKNSDHIFYISDQNIVERGTHEELMKNKVTIITLLILNLN